MSRAFRRFLARNRRNPLIASAAARCESWLRGFRNFDYDPVHNGELAVLRQIGAIHPSPVIFDVGANRGEWSKLALQACPNARVHAFEIVPATFERLRAAMGMDRRVVLHAHGLAGWNGEARVQVSGDDTRARIVQTEGVSCRVMTGDEVCARAGLVRLDLLKLDVEGAEFSVLSGFRRMLGETRIGAVQFEYGHANIAERVLLADFYRLLEPLGFVIGKIYPRYVDFRPYETAMEDFLGPNYLAVHRRETALIARLKP